MALTRKRLLLIGFIIVLLIGIPATLFVVQQQQELRSRAEKSTTLYFQPESTQTAPLEKNIGDTFTLDVFANPGTNLVSAIRVEINYDPAKLATASATPGESAFVADPTTLPNILFGPVYTPGKIAVTISAGADPTNVVDEISKVGTVTFQAIAGTEGAVTQVTYGTDTLVTSAGEESQFAENVLSSTTPAFITIPGDGPPPTTPPTGAPTATMTPTPTTPVVIVTGQPGPTGPEGPEGPQGPQGPPGESGPTPVFTIAPTASDTPTLTPTFAENPPTATPTLAPSGPGETVLGFGIALTILTILGGILFFAL
jgi:hypothetical protein